MRRCCWCCCGITPARAGKSGPKAGCRCCSWNYPRSRGEKQILAAGSVAWRELPPLARGKDWYEQNGIEINRITPARAGKSSSSCSTVARQRNYPRSRGEKHKLFKHPRHLPELPPLARGKVHNYFFARLHPGITPARAGKSSTQYPRPSRR